MIESTVQGPEREDARTMSAHAQASDVHSEKEKEECGGSVGWKEECGDGGSVGCYHQVKINGRVRSEQG